MLRHNLLLVVLLFLSATIFIFSPSGDARHIKKTSSAILVGTVYCETCSVSRNNHFISGATVTVECGDSRRRFRKEARTNEQGEFVVDLPQWLISSKHPERITTVGCEVKLVKSKDAYCAVASTSSISSSIELLMYDSKISMQGGVFTFKSPLKQLADDQVCNQQRIMITKLASSSESNNNEDQEPDMPVVSSPPGDQSDNNNTDLLPQLPSFPQLPPLPQLPSLPALPALPALPGLPKLPPKQGDDQKIHPMKFPIRSGNHEKSYSHPGFFFPPSNNPILPLPMINIPGMPMPGSGSGLNNNNNNNNNPAPAAVLPPPPSPTLMPIIPFPIPPLIPFPPTPPGFPGFPQATASIAHEKATP
ncbi:hypothetical protein Dimus_034167 [Dionaea muscipula]